MNIPTEEQFLDYDVYAIHSTAGSYNSITGQFVLGSGYIDSQEMFKGNIKTKDGAYIRMYIPVARTKRIPKDNLEGIAIYKEPICKTRDNFLFKMPGEFICKNKMGILEIPKNSIIKTMNFQ